MTSRSSFARAALLTFAVALAVRLLHVWSMRRSPLFDVLLGDARSYDSWARQIAAGDLLGSGVFYQAPLYAYLLGALYALGLNAESARPIQAVLGSVGPVVLGLAARQLFGPATGLIAGLMLAVYAPAVFFDGLIQKSTLDVLLLCILLAVLTRLDADRTAGSTTPRAVWSRWLAAGVALGFLSLTRENALLFLPAVLAWIWLHDGRRARHRVMATALFVAGVAAVILPVGIRNRVVGGEFHLTTAQMGPNLFIGANPRADGTYVPLRAGRGSPDYEQRDAADLAVRAVDRPLTPGEISSYWTGRALAYVVDHPIDWLALEGLKFRLFWNRIEIVDTESQESHEDDSPVLRGLARIAHFGVVAPLACLGVWLTWRERDRLWLLFALMGTYVVSVLAFYVVARYRLPIVPLLIIFAAAGVVRASSLLTAGPRGRQVSSGSIAGAACVLAVAVFCNIPAASADAMRAVTYQNVGAALMESGRVVEAATAFRRAIALAPDYPPPRSGLGSSLSQQGEWDQAIEELKTALRLAPDFDDARLNLANALAGAGRASEAIPLYEEVLAHEPGTVDAESNLGIALAGADRPDDAGRHFRAAVRLAPEQAKPHFNLGHFLFTRGNLAEAVSELSRALQLDPLDAQSHDELGQVYFASRRFAEAADEFRVTAGLRPGSADAHNNLGVALASAGRVEDAIEAFQGALELDPQSREAHANLQAALGLARQKKR